MANLIFSLNSVAPMITIIVIGYFLARVGILKEPLISQCNRLCYQIFLPIQLFRSIYTSDTGFSSAGSVLFFCVGGSLLLYALILLLSLKLERTPERRAGLATAYMKSNFILFGLSIASTLLGEGNIATVSLIIAVLVPINNIVVVTVFSMLIKDKQSQEGGNQLVSIVKKVLTNPIFLGAALALIVSRIPFTMPYFITKTIDQLANVSIPLALLLLGASFKFSNIAVYSKEILLTIVLKGMVIPGTALALGHMLGFTGAQMVAVLVVFGSPAASSSYVMAKEFGADDLLSANLVLFTSIVSAFTIFFGVLFLRTAGYL